MHTIMIIEFNLVHSSFSTKQYDPQIGACLQAAGISNAVELGSSGLKNEISYIIEVVPWTK